MKKTTYLAIVIGFATTLLCGAIMLTNEDQRSYSTSRYYTEIEVSEGFLSRKGTTKSLTKNFDFKIGDRIKNNYKLYLDDKHHCLIFKHKTKHENEQLIKYDFNLIGHSSNDKTDCE